MAGSRETIWATLLDAHALAALIPGAHDVRKLSDARFSAEVSLGVGPVKGAYTALVELSDLDPPRAATLSGSAEGRLGFGHGKGVVTLTETAPGHTVIVYRYEVAIGGKVASVGSRLLDGAARVIIGQFFAALAARASGRRRRVAWLGWLWGWWR